MDVPKCTRHLQPRPAKPSLMSPQRCFLHGVCFMVRSCSMGPTAIAYMVPYFPIRGLIGPSRQFGPHSIYHAQLYAIIIGALLPLPFWFVQRRRPDSWAKYVSTPVVLLGVSYIPPSVGINYSSWFAVGFVFQFIVRKRNFAWWSKYNYVTGAALDCGLYFYVFSLARRRLVTDGPTSWLCAGTVLSLLAIFFVLQLPRGGFNVNWWGNSVFTNSAFPSIFFPALVVLMGRV